MGIFRWLFGRSKPDAGGDTSPAPTGPEHAVLLHIRLGDDRFGLDGEVGEMHALQDELERAVQEANAGILDGDEFGGGECVVYLYGPNAQVLWDAIEPVLEKRPFRKGSYATLRFGPADADDAPQERIDLRWDG